VVGGGVNAEKTAAAGIEPTEMRHGVRYLGCCFRVFIGHFFQKFCAAK